MSFTVRIFGYQGLARVPVSDDGKTLGTDSVYTLHQPYLWRQQLTASGTSAPSTAAGLPPAHASDPTRLLRVEVPDGSTIRYAITTDGTTPVADANSPLLTGRDNIMFNANWRIAVLDATGT